MKNSSDPTGSVWRSAGFRLAFYYGFLATCTMIATVVIIYIRTTTVFYQQMTRQVEQERQKMTERFNTDGLQALTLEIERQLSDGNNDSSEIFLLLGPDGRKLAGNLDAPPKNLAHHDRRLLSQGGKSIEGYITQHTLSDGSIIYVGNNLRDQEAVESLVASGIGGALVAAVLLLIGGIFVFRQELVESITPLRRTLLQVANGDLKARVQAVGSNDEFDLLGKDINRMIDRIEVLINGVQHVSNTIAHNLRTPLTRILLRLRDCAAEENVSAEQRQKFDKTVAEIEDLIAVFEKLLHIAEAEAGAGRIQFQPVELCSVVREVLEFYAVLAEQSGGQIHCDLGNDGEVRILGDADLMAQALSNLVDNALKHGGLHTTVSLTVDTSQGLVTVGVSDNGTGVPVHHVEQLGNRFFRLNREVAGHGLGLSAVAAIVASHGGSLQFADAQPGLSVRMVLPLHQP